MVLILKLMLQQGFTWSLQEQLKSLIWVLLWCLDRRQCFTTERMTSVPFLLQELSLSCAVCIWAPMGRPKDCQGIHAQKASHLPASILFSFVPKRCYAWSVVHCSCFLGRFLFLPHSYRWGLPVVQVWQCLESQGSRGWFEAGLISPRCPSAGSPFGMWRDSRSHSWGMRGSLKVDVSTRFCVLLCFRRVHPTPRGQGTTESFKLAFLLVKMKACIHCSWACFSCMVWSCWSILSLPAAIEHRKEFVKLRLSSWHCCRFPSFPICGIILSPRHQKASRESLVLCRLWYPCQIPEGRWWLWWLCHSVLRATYLL